MTSVSQDGVASVAVMSASADSVFSSSETCGVCGGGVLCVKGGWFAGLVCGEPMFLCFCFC